VDGLYITRGRNERLTQDFRKKSSRQGHIGRSKHTCIWEDNTKIDLKTMRAWNGFNELG
jgi:hypothetical protein